MFAFCPRQGTWREAVYKGKVAIGGPPAFQHLNSLQSWLSSRVPPNSGFRAFGLAAAGSMPSYRPLTVALDSFACEAQRFLPRFLTPIHCVCVCVCVCVFV